ncbi:hypothetical protein FRB99_002818, partial [Tulasnella sp. 403]
MASNAPFGTWKSPIMADLITQKTISISGIQVDPVSGTIYHAESRPSEAGRTALVNSKLGQEILQKEYNVRSSVHEYGGTAFTVRGNVVFTDFNTKRLYVITSDGTTKAVSPENHNHRFADFDIHPIDTHWIATVLEDHTKPAPCDVVNSIALVNTETQAVTTIASGADFYSTPRFSPDGKHISWIQWYHPNMPWEGSLLYLADFNGGEVTNVKNIAGKRDDESINQAFWVTPETLVYLTDVSGFYNPWKHDVPSQSSAPILKQPVPLEYADPAWFLGASRWAAMDSNTLIVSPTDNGVASVSLIDIATGKRSPIVTPYVSISFLRSINDREAVLVGVTDDTPAALIHLTLPASASTLAQAGESITPGLQVLKETSSLPSTISSAYFPTHQALALSIPPSGEPLHVLYFPPTNPEYAGGEGNELPPCVVNIHGGPTARAVPGLSWLSTYFTSRGWAWVDVNYGGSSGFGKKYRDRLRGNWGIVDVEDSVAAVEQLGARGLVDPKRAAIRGGSAGGYTVLAAIVTHPDAFGAATSSYGISDLAGLAAETHKFESRYLERLIGGTLEEIPEVYKERSPLFHANKIKSPLLILQGAEDKVVPPSQAEAIVQEVKANNGTVEYVIFEGEGHGWRMAQNIKLALEKEEAFYRDV